MMRHLKKNIIRFARKTNGAALVEFAIILPLFMSLIFGCIEFSLYMYNRHVLTNACREAGRFGIIMRPAPRDIHMEKEMVSTRFSSILDDVSLITFGNAPSPAPQITYELGEDGRIDFGDSLSVSADYSYDFLFLSSLGIGPVNIHAFSSMRME